jgi:hypothetical protein
MPSSDFVHEAPWRAGLRGARANALPGFILQAGALALVLAYYRHAPTREILSQLAAFREKTGTLFGFVSTGLFGGLIPVLYLFARCATRHRYTGSQAAGLIAFWSYKGFEVDLWYRLQARLLGTEADLGTIAAKMALDQFVYCPLVAVPVTVLVYAWVEARYSAQPVLSDLREPRWYFRQVLPVLISNLGVWVPAVCLIYALPTPLQLPLQNLVLCFFTLLLAHLTLRKSPTVGDGG